VINTFTGYRLIASDLPRSIDRIEAQPANGERIIHRGETVIAAHGRTDALTAKRMWLTFR